MSWTRTRIIDELLLMFRTNDLQIDPKTGHKHSKYERQAEFILIRINVYKPPPAFILSTNDLVTQLKTELSNLDDETLDDVMREAIYRLLDESNTSEFRVDILRRNIRWEIPELK